MTIRQYRPEDHAALLEIFTAGVLIHATAEDIDFWKNYVKKSIDEDLANIHEVYVQPGGNFWVAVVEDEVVGMIGLEAKSDHEGELRRLMVKASTRGFGIGRLLVGRLELWAKESGFKRVILGTGEVMHPARKLYASFGYEHTHTVVINRDPVVTVLWLAKSIA